MEYITTWDKKLGELDLEGLWTQSNDSEKQFVETTSSDEYLDRNYLQFTIKKQRSEVNRVFKNTCSEVLQVIEDKLKRIVKLTIRNNLELLTEAYKNMQQQYKAVRKDFCVSKPNIGFSANLRDSDFAAMEAELSQIEDRITKLNRYLEEILSKEREEEDHDDGQASIDYSETMQ